VELAANFDKLDNSTTREEVDIKTYHSASGGCAEAFNAVTPVLSKFVILLTSAIRVPVLSKPSRVFLFDLVPVSETDQHHRCRLHHGITLLNLSALAIAELANPLSPFDCARDDSVHIMM
jgi:hypothetical protein